MWEGACGGRMGISKYSQWLTPQPEQSHSIAPTNCFEHHKVRFLFQSVRKTKAVAMFPVMFCLKPATVLVLVLFSTSDSYWHSWLLCEPSACTFHHNLSSQRCWTALNWTTQLGPAESQCVRLWDLGNHLFLGNIWLMLTQPVAAPEGGVYGGKLAATSILYLNCWSNNLRSVGQRMELQSEERSSMNRISYS